MPVYKDQGINWKPQSDSLGVSPLKQTHSTHPIISGLHCLVEGLRQLICFIGCFTSFVDASSKEDREQRKQVGASTPVRGTKWVTIITVTKSLLSGDTENQGNKWPACRQCHIGFGHYIHSVVASLAIWNFLAAYEVVHDLINHCWSERLVASLTHLGSQQWHICIKCQCTTQTRYTGVLHANPMVQTFLTCQDGSDRHHTSE